MNAPANKIHIVLADDDEDDRELFEMAVKELPIPVDVTFMTDGKKLISYLNEHEEPDIIFLDLNMPFKSGIECLEILRSNEKHKHLPMIILSTSSAKRDIDKCYELGANFYIVKPFSYVELSTIIKNVLDENWKDAEPRSKSDFLYKGYL